MTETDREFLQSQILEVRTAIGILADVLVALNAKKVCANG